MFSMNDKNGFSRQCQVKFICFFFINKNTCLFVFGHKLDSAAVISCLVVSSKKCKQFSIDLGGLGVSALFINPHAQTLKPILFVSNYAGSPYY